MPQHRQLGNQNIGRDAERLAVITRAALKGGSVLVLAPSFPTLTDTTGTAWAGSRNPSASTTYSFDANGNGNSWPTTAKAVLVYFAGAWASVASTTWITGHQRGQTTILAQWRAAATNGTMGQSIIPTDSNGDIDLIVGGTAPTVCTLRLIGWLI